MYLYCSSCVCCVLSFFSLVFLSHFITHWLHVGALLLFFFSSILSCRFVFILWFFMFPFFRHFLSDSWYRFCHSLCPSFLLLCLLGCFCGHVCVSFWLLVNALMSYCYSSLFVYIPFFPSYAMLPKKPNVTSSKRPTTSKRARVNDPEPAQTLGAPATFPFPHRLSLANHQWIRER